MTNNVRVWCVCWCVEESDGLQLVPPVGAQAAPVQLLELPPEGFKQSVPNQGPGSMILL